MGRRGTYFLAWWIWGASTAKKQMQTEDDSYFCVEIDSKLSNTLCHWIQISSLIIIAVPIQDTLPTTDSDWFCALNLYLIDSSLQNDTMHNYASNLCYFNFDAVYCCVSYLWQLYKVHKEKHRHIDKYMCAGKAVPGVEIPEQPIFFLGEMVKNHPHITTYSILYFMSAGTLAWLYT